ncbi:hypothetical protein V500_05801 [Pseudogymnoascus sp. VKM F-4518 (FW-2643)]|nr:hypothetical protein V500_05801 [Pseudogymnoascus sp. VKM F-4518 (FW-2643)]
MATIAEPDMELEGLSDVEATIDFTNPKDFPKTLQALFYDAYDRDPTGYHTILVTAFPNKYFTIDDDERPLIPGSRKALYFEDSEILLTMRGGPHEIAAVGFGDRLFQKINEIGCYGEIVSIGRKTTLIGTAVKKEPDASRALSRDARIWLEHDESKVTQVIAVKISRQRPEIIFTVWKRAAREQRDTRANHPLRAVVDQEILVTLQAGRPVAEGMLRLSFQELFERQPRPGTAEGDINFSARELGGIARRVWSEMSYEIE